MNKITIDKNKNIPLYMQVYSQIKRFIENGSLPGGYKLPTIRSLAKELGVNNITIINAYKLLEQNGYVYTKVGSGTYVCEDIKKDDEMEENIKSLDQGQFALRKGMINFASSSPNPELFPVEDFRELINRVLKRDGGYAFEYQDTKGYKPLRESVKEFVKKDQIFTSIDNIQIISGGQQGIDVVSKALINFEDAIIAERPTYSWALASFESRGAEILEVELQKDGIDLEELEDKLKKFKPRFIYVIPNFHNPTGITYSEEKKKKLISLAEKYETYVVEDDFASELSFTKEKTLPLKAYDKHDRVIYIKSFSKVYMPGLRLGFIIAPERFVSSFLKAKYVSDLSTSGLMQRAFDLYLRENIWVKHVESIKQVMYERFSEMGRRLENLKNYTEFEHPKGGFYFWLKLKNNLSAKSLYSKCLDRNLMIVPGDIFFMGKKENSFVRLSFASCEVKEIAKGIEILGEILKGYFDENNNVYVPII
ncbi:GntR family transcriptional regulator [Thermoanaerobacter kivui]|uniref:GntR family transcriptional regulator n=1 Tax=Thermoanaerobacter kivui TaxID=2325 RepID=A0A097AQI3_THEKI|nr:PLP-dependent aminotransferase family protein [Thermoanaerobacter kivui]AIS52047.1 GntR family transcriptional regulator [Thermoanaerobacter kivui]